MEYTTSVLMSSLREMLESVSWTTWLLIALATYIIIKRIRWEWRIDVDQDRYVLVTGCDTGVGFDLVQRLDKLGFSVFAGCLTSDGVERVGKVTSKRVMPLSLDVCNLDSIQEVVDNIKSTIPPGKGLWGLVNNAGVMLSLAPFELTSRKSFERAIAVNLMGVVDVTRACLPLVRQARGRIVNMSSISGIVGFVAPDYTCSKFAVEGFTNYLRFETVGDGLHIATMNPGGFRSSLFCHDRYANEQQHVMETLTPEVQEYYGGKAYVERRKIFLKNFTWYLKYFGSPVEKVTDSYVHALTARFPFTRYVIGYDANCFFWPLWCMPDVILNFIGPNLTTAHLH